VNLAATIDNSLWSASNLPSYFRFRRALEQPELAQTKRLQAYLERNQRTAFGQKYAFDSIRSYEEFVKRVPLTSYEDLEPWIERIRRGEPRVLTCDPVTRLVPTSGSSGARKLIPFTAALQREFNSAIGPWLLDSLCHSPGIAGGPAYWSVTPITDRLETESSTVPIGFDADTAYLGGTRQRLASTVMAVPEELRGVPDLEVFRYVTLLCLLRQRDLRLISVWHPSFFTLLLDALPGNWQYLLADLRSGRCRYASQLPTALLRALKLRPLPKRVEELLAADPRKPETLWPHLKLISCWGDGSAEIAASKLKELLPNTPIQPKGLLATEACVAIPFAERHPMAVCSHFFEFKAEAGRILRGHELQLDETYEVIVTTSGGLWRYPLRDCVRVTGFVGRTPSLKFLGRAGNVSDLFGEKLSEAFVAKALQETLVASDVKPSFVLLAPEEDELGFRYTLYIEGEVPERFETTFDRALRQNPHYAYCRDLGQLLPVRVFIVEAGGYEKFVAYERCKGARLGNVKPIVLSRNHDWSKRFVGAYFAEASLK
jgi:hypothetical protein